MTALGAFLADPANKQRLLTHPDIAGVVGAQAQTLARNQLAAKEAKAQKESEQDKLERMIKDAEKEAAQNPDGFSARWLKGMKRERKDEAANEVRASVRVEFGETLGKAIGAIPEFRELSPQEVAALAQVMVGKPPDQVIAVYTAAVLDKLAEKRAQKMHGTWKEKDLDTEAKARVKEANARRVATQPSPGLRAPSAGNTRVEPKMGTPEWDRWYETAYLGRRGA